MFILPIVICKSYYLNSGLHSVILALGPGSAAFKHSTQPQARNGMTNVPLGEETKSELSCATNQMKPLGSVRAGWLVFYHGK